MFPCPVCRRCALKGIGSELQGPILLGSDVLHVATRRLSPASKLKSRTHATVASLKTRHHRSIAIKSLPKWDKSPRHLTLNRRRKAPNALTKPEIKDALAREKNRAAMARQYATEEHEDEDDDEDEDEDDAGQIGVEQNSHNLGETTAKDNHAKDDVAKQRQKAIRSAQKEVELYYRDPLQLAGGVINRLRVPDIEGALTLVRASEAFQVDNVVSWNHCLDWLMSQGEVKQATKVYNEMKKRGHRPDAHTYTLMLRGISQRIAPSGYSIRTPVATTKTKTLVQDAVSIYNSIFAPNSAVKPSTIHTNAIINVCARAGEMDSLWAIAGRLPEHGPGSPDQYTYTTILNAIRDHTIKEVAKTVESNASQNLLGLDAEQTRRGLYERALADGRKLWEEVSYKWRRANLIMDEQLVCAMGRLLIGCGASKDVFQVLDLVDICMNIKIRERRDARIANWLIEEDGNGRSASTDGREAELKQNDADLTPKPLQATHEDQAANGAALPLNQSSMYASPSNNTLSMILHAAALHPTVQDLSKHYWIRLTDPNRQYRIVPDAANIIAYLRILRKTRSSHEAYKLLSRDWPEDVQKELYRRATFVMAFSTCLRDKNNPNAFETGRKLFELMTRKLESSAEALFEEDAALAELNGKARKRALKERAEELSTDPEEFHRRQDGVQSMTVDPKILRYFTDLAIDTTRGWQEAIRGKDDGEKFERDPKKNRTMIALGMIQPHIVELQRLIKLKLDEMQYSDVPELQRARKNRITTARNRYAGHGTKVGEKIEDLLDLMRTVIGAYDRVVDMADRFSKTGRAPIEPSLVKQYDMAKRQYNAYMAKIEKTTKHKLRTASAFADEQDLNDEELIGTNEPEIGRQLQSITDGVNTEIRAYVAARRQRRTQKKGFRRFEVADSKTPLRLSSRRQQRERENILGEKMQKQFPPTEHADLGPELQLEYPFRPRSNTDRVKRPEYNLRQQHKGTEGNEYKTLDGTNPSILESQQVREVWDKARTQQT